MAQRHILMLCILSALIGALTAGYLSEEPGPGQLIAAQEPNSARISAAVIEAIGRLSVAP